MSEQSVVPIRANVPGIPWTQRQLATMQQTVAKDTNVTEFDLFINVAIAKRLDPFLKQIIAVVFNKDTPAKRQMSIIVTQGGLRVIAARCGDYHPAKPGDTVYTLTDYEIERQRLIGEAKKIFSRDARAARLADIQLNMPADPTNPAGIIKVETILWKGAEPVAGEAYWSEFAPLRPNPEIFEWVETGETYEDSGRPKKRKKLKAGVTPADNMILDDSGQWAKMPHVMLCKCATVQGLNAGWPTELSGIDGSEETIEKQRVLDLTASEMVEMDAAERRARAIGQAENEFPYVDAEGNLSFVPAGRFADLIIGLASNCTTRAELDGMEVRNREGFRRFWAGHKADALEMRAELEKIAAKLPEPKLITADA